MDEQGNSKLQQLWNRVLESLSEQVWYQELKSKYDGLDPQTRMLTKAGSALSVVLILLISVITSIAGVRSLKSELDEKAELVRIIQSGNEELRRLRDEAGPGGRGSGADTQAPWIPWIEGVAQTAGVTREALTISGEKEGRSTDQARESMFDLTASKVNIRQLAKLAWSLENGNRPVKLRHLDVKANPDGSGWLSAKLAISGFSLKPANGATGTKGDK